MELVICEYENMINDVFDCDNILMELWWWWVCQYLYEHCMCL